MNARRARYLAAGMCGSCGCRPPREGTTTCVDCYASQAAWRKTEAGRRRNRQSHARYRKSQKGKATSARYWKSPKGRAALKRYQQKYAEAQPKNWCRCGVKKWVTKKMCHRCRDVRFMSACAIILMQKRDLQVIDLFESSYEHVLPWPWNPDAPSQVATYAEDDLRSAMVVQGAEVGRWRNTLFGGTPDL